MLRIDISEESLVKEFTKIQNTNFGYSSGNYWNEIVLFFQWQEFYKTELQMWKDNNIIKGLPLRSFIYANRMKYANKGYTQLTDREILRAFKISGLHIGNSFHSPFWIKQFIHDYNIKSIYDPCGGWGHRLLGSYNIKYIYNDINTITANNCKKIAEYFNLLDKYFYTNDSALFTPQESYEAIFTCPPYFNIEKYTNIGSENYSYPDFLNWWQQTVIKSTACPSCKYFCFIMNSTYLIDMQKICTNLGLQLLEQQLLGSSKQVSHFNKSKSRKQEILSVFRVR